MIASEHQSFGWFRRHAARSKALRARSCAFLPMASLPRFFQSIDFSTTRLVSALIAFPDLENSLLLEMAPSGDSTWCAMMPVALSSL